MKGGSTAGPGRMTGLRLMSYRYFPACYGCESKLISLSFFLSPFWHDVVLVLPAPPPPSLPSPHLLPTAPSTFVSLRSFHAPLSPPTILSPPQFFILTTMTCLVFITNSALFNLRNKHAQQHAMSQQQQQQQQGQYIAQGQQGQREREQERQERQELERERERRRLWRQQLPSSAGPGPDHRHSNSLEPEEEDEHEDDRRFLGVGEGRRDSTIGESGRKEGNQQSKFLFEWPPRR